jgi:hypothetical protein
MKTPALLLLLLAATATVSSAFAFRLPATPLANTRVAPVLKASSLLTQQLQSQQPWGGVRGGALKASGGSNDGALKNWDPQRTCCVAGGLVCSAMGEMGDCLCDAIRFDSIRFD